MFLQSSTSAPLFAQCGHENFAWLEIIADDGDYQGKILALGKAWLKAREVLVVIHHKASLLVAFYGMAIAGSYQPQVNSLGIRPDETQVDTRFLWARRRRICFGLTPYGGAR
ncbi:hypothetical protein ACSS6W_001651 [Trichoderma asperelloides]